MSGQGSLFKFFNAFGSYRNALTNRASILSSQHLMGMKTSTKEKLKNLPVKPKRPATPFIRYMVEQRSGMKDPKMKLMDLIKTVSESWKKLDDAAKQKYLDAYKTDFIEYEKKYVVYATKLTDEQKQMIKDVKNEISEEKKSKDLKKFLKESGKPKRPLSVHNIFLKDKCKELNVSLRQAMEMKLWEKLTEAEKKQYMDKAAEMRKKYTKEIEEWEAKMVREGNTDVIRKDTRAEMKPKRPLKPKSSTSE